MLHTEDQEISVSLSLSPSISLLSLSISFTDSPIVFFLFAYPLISYFCIPLVFHLSLLDLISTCLCLLSLSSPFPLPPLPRLPICIHLSASSFMYRLLSSDHLPCFLRPHDIEIQILHAAVSNVVSTPPPIKSIYSPPLLSTLFTPPLDMQS